jgi:hypothetical protein
MTGCEHHWGHHAPGAPLACARCGMLWPGEPLPDTPAQGPRPGYGDLAELPGWGERLRAMTAELGRVA